MIIELKSIVFDDDVMARTLYDKFENRINEGNHILCGGIQHYSNDLSNAVAQISSIELINGNQFLHKCKILDTINGRIVKRFIETGAGVFMNYVWGAQMDPDNNREFFSEIEDAFIGALPSSIPFPIVEAVL